MERSFHDTAVREEKLRNFNQVLILTLSFVVLTLAITISYLFVRDFYPLRRNNYEIIEKLYEESNILQNSIMSKVDNQIKNSETSQREALERIDELQMLVKEQQVSIIRQDKEISNLKKETLDLQSLIRTLQDEFEHTNSKLKKLEEVNNNTSNKSPNLPPNINNSKEKSGRQ
jgi:peptidoglycan hydrolase CwlO-like protein